MQARMSNPAMIIPQAMQALQTLGAWRSPIGGSEGVDEVPRGDQDCVS
jgi:hypothetical protein